MSILLAAGLAGITWFVVAAGGFFNPLVDRVYRAQEGHPAVRALPQGAATVARILLAIAVQTVLWALVYRVVAPALPAGVVPRGLAFGAILCATKVVPRDVDRVLLTTYPARRMAIEFVIGLACALVVGLVFAAVS